MSIREEYAKKIIAEEFDELLSILNKLDKTSYVFFLLGSIPYICLLVNEAICWLHNASIDTYEFESKEILVSIRAKAKLYSNDNCRSFDIQKEELENIVKNSYQFFKKSAKSYAPDFLINDIGAYIVNGKYIGNTIQYSYDFSEIIDDNSFVLDNKNGEEIQSFGSELGKYIRHITGCFPTDTSIDCSKNISFEIKNKDFRFSRKIKTVDNMIVFCLQCRINFILYFLSEISSKSTTLYLRIIYLTFYSLKNDLDRLQISYGDIFNELHVRKFRNCMAHYSLYNKINENEFIDGVIGFGLAEKYFNLTAQDLILRLEDKLERIHQLLNNIKTI